MRIKSYKGRNTAEALRQVKADMGDDALIIQTKATRDKGLLGIFGKTGVEIVAATDDAPAASGGRSAAGLERKPATRAKSAAPAPPTPFDLLQQRLVRTGIDDKLAGTLVQDVKTLSSGRPIKEPGRLSAALAQALSRRVRTTGGLSAWAGGTRVVAFVGPTGVGKTTTISKLAANLALRRGRRVELITIDAHRLAAIEQLKTSAELIGIPVHVAYTPEEFASALLKASKAEFIFIDTPGCSYRNTSALLELQQYFRAVPDIEVNVLLSCAWRLEDATAAAGAFKTVAAAAGRNPGKTEPVQLLFTKLDETSRGGSMLTVASRCRLPLSYICDGQEIPDDIEVTTPEILSRILLTDAQDRREGIA